MSFSELTTDWLPLPNGVAAERPMFVLTDIHGCADLMAAAMNRAQNVSEGHELVVLGDITDRGPDSMGCVRLALGAQKNTAFSDVTLLMGNHDEVLDAFVQDPEAEDQRSNLVMMGGRPFLNQIDKDPEALSLLEDYVRGLVRFHVNGGLALTHALPDPTLPLSEQKDSTLAWNAGYQEYRGGWDALLGATTVLVHGHTRNGVGPFDEGMKKAEDAIFLTLTRHRRICCDVGTPWTGQAALFEFKADMFRIHGFRRTA